MLNPTNLQQTDLTVFVHCDDHTSVHDTLFAVSWINKHVARSLIEGRRHADWHVVHAERDGVTFSDIMHRHISTTHSHVGPPEVKQCSDSCHTGSINDVASVRKNTHIDTHAPNLDTGSDAK